MVDVAGDETLFIAHCARESRCGSVVAVGQEATAAKWNTRARPTASGEPTAAIERAAWFIENKHGDATLYEGEAEQLVAALRAIPSRDPAKAMSYDDCHAEAVRLGYSSIADALDHLEVLLIAPESLGNPSDGQGDK